MNNRQQKAVLIVLKVLERLSFKAGETENAVAVRIKNLLKEYDARPAFRIIVASGKRSAKPHGYATNKKIQKGELVMIDFGAAAGGFHSDITRTFTAGNPSQKQKKILKIVLEAGRKAIALIKPGVRCMDVDGAARGYIEEKGFGKFFIHSTGHGIGEKVHQAPKISRKNRQKLKAGQVITIEPGIYIKGWGGIRIEDMVLVTRKGGRILTRAALR